MQQLMRDGLLKQLSIVIDDPVTGYLQSCQLQCRDTIRRTGPNYNSC